MISRDEQSLVTFVRTSAEELTEKNISKTTKTKLGFISVNAIANTSVLLNIAKSVVANYLAEIRNSALVVC